MLQRSDKARKFGFQITSSPPITYKCLVKTTEPLHLSALRSALELLLGEMEVASVDANGKFLSLARRINLLPEASRKIIEPANAIRWLGNDGTHEGGFRVRKSDVLDGYRIFELFLLNYIQKREHPLML